MVLQLHEVVEFHRLLFLFVAILFDARSVDDVLQLGQPRVPLDGVKEQHPEALVFLGLQQEIALFSFEVDAALLCHHLLKHGSPMLLAFHHPHRLFEHVFVPRRALRLRYRLR